MRHRIVLSVLLLVLWPSLGGAQSSSYTFTPVNVPGAIVTLPQGINDRGQVVGYYAAPTIPPLHHGFLYEHGEFTPIDVPPEGGFITQTFAFGLNNRGEIVGEFFSHSDFALRAFVTRVGEFQTIEIPECPVSVQPRDINDHGDIVGDCTDADEFRLRAFLLTRDDAPQIIDFPGASLTAATGINNRGDIVGWFVVGTGALEGFLLRQGSFLRINVPDSLLTLPLGINDRGQIVGLFEMVQNQTQAFVLDKGGFSVLPVPRLPGEFAVATGINNRGQIVGYTGTSGVANTEVGFLATPQR